MNLNIELDTKNNKCFANKILGETDYYIGLTKVCARCKNSIVGYPAISRKDNKTEICSNCGTLEALEDFNAEGIQAAIKAAGKAAGAKGKMLFMPCRIATTGQMHGPDLPKALALLGKETVVGRIAKFI